MATLDDRTRQRMQKIPLLKTDAGPGSEEWSIRLKEELTALVQYIQKNKAEDQDWFTIKPKDKDGVHWSGSCWSVHELVKYEMPFEFEIPQCYPTTAPEIKIPSMQGKTAKMYRGGAICLTVHFKPLWAKNCPKFGIAHALALGLAPWLAAEVPHLVGTGALKAAG